MPSAEIESFLEISDLDTLKAKHLRAFQPSTCDQLEGHWWDLLALI